jgi:hypothetical protein
MAATTTDPRAAILAACDETERLAKAATDGDGVWIATGRDVETRSGRTVAIPTHPEIEEYVAAHDPATVLREMAALRAFVTLHLGETDIFTCVCTDEDGDYCFDLAALADGLAPGWREAP